MSVAPALPFCAEQARAVAEPLDATASIVEHWLLVEYGGYWPRDPLDAAPFAGRLREHLVAQLARLRHSRLYLVKQSGSRARTGVTVVLGRARERGSRFHRLELDGHPDLLGLDLAGPLLGEAPLPGEPLDHPLLLVCTHGTRDRCCARYGQELCRAANASGEGGWVWQTTHVGGDRFAGNLVVLPEALTFGRVGEAELPAVLGEYLAGRIHLDHYRGRAAYGFPEQAAEGHVRRATGLKGLNDLRLLSRHRLDGRRWRVELLAEVAGVVHEVEVARELGEPRLLTCTAAEARAPRRFVVRAHRERAAD